MEIKRRARPVSAARRRRPVGRSVVRVETVESGAPDPTRRDARRAARAGGRGEARSPRLAAIINAKSLLTSDSLRDIHQEHYAIIITWINTRYNKGIVGRRCALRLSRQPCMMRCTKFSQLMLPCESSCPCSSCSTCETTHSSQRRTTYRTTSQLRFCASE